MGSIWLDVRSGFGQLRRAPLVATAAVLTLAVGIGVTTAVFSFVAAVLDASTPVDDMDRRVALWSRNIGETESKRATSPGDFLDWRARATTVDSVVAVRSRAFNLSGVRPASARRGQGSQLRVPRVLSQVPDHRPPLHRGRCAGLERRASSS